MYELLQTINLQPWGGWREKKQNGGGVENPIIGRGTNVRLWKVGR